ncbi:MAG: translation elongation factor 4 [Gemmatimonadetes bacterium]|nr:translation elongation factor 4 [Gemmatimonadota bacterium]MCB9519043.1 elongation factor 4 [Gemmatimonadales bacterium]HPF61170.1 translation elongation factor 4 [Gemmatimonadales bacterium]HRX19634.1 translation elongation factor 4 [Gemmatimonadales bacterium]
MRQSLLRNFCIVAHIDHGKSTLADRLIELTATVSKREMREQLTDTMDLERERGITIKLNAVRMAYRAADGETYALNLIDTPGHVDFTYEVSRSLNACEGAILVVDASQGIQAQTLSNLFLALDAGLEIIPVLNKIDLPGAEPEKRAQEIMDLIGASRDEILAVSAKDGTGVPELLEAIVRRVPPPTGDPAAPLRALIFDSYYDRYRGAIPSIRVVDGTLAQGMEIAFGAHPDEVYRVDEVGYLALGQRRAERLETGEVGYFVASLRDVRDARVGDTVLDADRRATTLLPGYREVKSMVFAGVYPTDVNQYEDLRDALEKLILNDASLQYEPEVSTALGFGFRCGFLGLLHLEIVQERLEREFGLDLITTVPTVEYDVYLTDGTMRAVENPSDLPDPATITRIEEPFVKARIMAPTEYIGGIMKLGQERRGVYHGMTYIDQARVEFTFDFPLGEIVLDFYDRLKSISRGYASLDYEMIGFRPSPLVRLDMLLNGDPIDAFSVIIHRDKAYEWGRKVAEKLKELIPRQLFAVAIQAAIGNKVIARETISAMRKDVLAKCYGGDISRKRKLLEKQKEGKKRMKQIGSVEIPQEAFLAVLQVD